jgi:hypothetical protein
MLGLPRSALLGVQNTPAGIEIQSQIRRRSSREQSEAHSLKCCKLSQQATSTVVQQLDAVPCMSGHVVTQIDELQLPC